MIRLSETLDPTLFRRITHLSAPETPRPNPFTKLVAYTQTVFEAASHKTLAQLPGGIAASECQPREAYVC